MDTLPWDLRRHQLFRYLPHQDLLGMCSTNRFYARICRDPQTWSFLLQRDFNCRYSGPLPRYLYDGLKRIETIQKSYQLRIDLSAHWSFFEKWCHHLHDLAQTLHFSGLLVQIDYSPISKKISIGSYFSFSCPKHLELRIYPVQIAILVDGELRMEVITETVPSVNGLKRLVENFDPTDDEKMVNTFNIFIRNEFPKWIYDGELFSSADPDSFESAELLLN